MIFFSFLTFLYMARIDVGLNVLQPDEETRIATELQYSPQLFYSIYCGHETDQNICEYPSDPKKPYCALNIAVVRGDTALICSCGDCVMNHWQADLELDDRSNSVFSFMMHHFYGTELDSLKAFQTNRCVGFIVYPDARDPKHHKGVDIIGSYFYESGKRQHFKVQSIDPFHVREKGIEWNQDLQVKLIH